jgi:hypothetical protein
MSCDRLSDEWSKNIPTKR